MLKKMESQNIYENVIKKYSDAFRLYGNSPKSVFIPKGRQKERFDALTCHIVKDSFSLLDYGCGIGYLKKYLDEKFTDFRYTGVDIVDDFIFENNKKFKSKNTAFKRITSFKDVVDVFDYAVLSGVFNILYTTNKESHKNIIYETLTHLFKYVRVSLSVDFMTDQVDFMQEMAYHQNIIELYNMITHKLSKRIIINQSYMPYEFSIIIFKNQEIIRPDNVFKEV